MESVKWKNWKYVIWPNTLKGRLIILLVIVTITPIFLVGFTSFYWMYKVQLEKISASYQSMLNNEDLALQKAFTNLGNVSQLLVVNGGLGDDVIDYLTNPDPVEKTFLFLAIDKSLLNIIYSNPTINALYFYIPTYTSSIQFETSPLKTEFILDKDGDILSRPLYRANLLTFHAPHPSVLKGHDELVVSLTRKIEFGADQYYYIYLESKFVDLIHSLSNGPSDINPRKLLVNTNGTVLYSDIPNAIQVGSTISEDSESLKKYKLFQSKEKNGWMLYSLVPLGDYLREMKQWQRQFLLVAALSLLVTIAAAAYIWRMVYRPLQRINREIKGFGHDRKASKIPQKQLKEFDMLFNSFRDMWIKVIDLITEVERKEKHRGELEVEKLMLQINPHFLHNSLNTIQWLARENGQNEIVNLVKVFTRVLHYNLGKSSMIVTVEAEIGALNDYIELQNIRYDHRFNVEVQLDPELKDIAIPRFVLQPLVENALYHGLLSEHGNIRVTISRIDSSLVSIRVVDNGGGIPPEKIEKLLRGDGSRETGLGIGLNYVKKMLDVYYDQRAELNIESILNEGTKITIIMPEQIERGDDHD